MLTAAHIALISDQQAASIQKKSLTEPQLDLCLREKWFKIWVPKELNGKALGLLEGLDLLEAIAYEDGSLGWTVTLCSGANMFVGYIDPTASSNIFKADHICLGGSGQVAGRAYLQQNGDYLVSGHWKYATGSTHLTHFTANCHIYDQQGNALYTADGTELVKSFYFDREDVLIHYDWDSFGLESTASHSFSVSNLSCPATRSFDINPERVTWEYPLYQFPFIPFAQATLLANYMGMFHKFMDLVEKEFMLRSVKKDWFQDYGKSYLKKHDIKFTEFLEQQKIVKSIIKEAWQNHLIAADNTLLYAKYEEHAKRLVTYIRDTVMVFYPYCGIAASQRFHELNIVFRNIFTASQHALLLDKTI